MTGVDWTELTQRRGFLKVKQNLGVT